VGLENPLHIAIILVVVLMVFGAKRLPEMGKGLGEGMRGFKQSLSGEEPAPQISLSQAEQPQAPAAQPVAQPVAPARQTTPAA
jgi:sec-independent protein translocase protein TatA